MLGDPVGVARCAVVGGGQGGGVAEVGDGAWEAILEEAGGVDGGGGGEGDVCGGRGAGRGGGGGLGEDAGQGKKPGIF